MIDLSAEGRVKIQTFVPICGAHEGLCPSHPTSKDFRADACNCGLDAIRALALSLLDELKKVEKERDELRALLKEIGKIIATEKRP